MAVYTSINYQQPVNSGLVNEHTSEVIAPGIYRGMFIRSHGPESRCLDVRNVQNGDLDTDESRTDIYGMAFMPQGMKVFMSAPQFYNEEDPILSKLVVEPAGLRDRVDLVCLHYEYKKVIFNHNKPSYVIIKGEEADSDRGPEYPWVFSDDELSPEEGKTEEYFRRRRIPMAFIIVRAGSQYVTDADIINIRHSMNTNEIQDYISQMFDEIIGNCRYNGWSIYRDADEFNVIVTPGYGFIAGRIHRSMTSDTIQDIRPQIILMNSKNPSENLSLDVQPPYPTALKIHIESTSSSEVPSGSSFLISGVWVDGASQVEETREFTLPSAIPAGGSVDIVTDEVVSIVEAGINLAGLVGDVSSSELSVSIKNSPVAYILAMAQEDNRPRFRAEYDPRYVADLSVDEMLLGTVTVDDSRFIIVINTDINNDKIRFSIAKIPDLDPMFARPR